MFNHGSRHYWVSFFLCLSVSVLSLMGDGAFDRIKWLILSDINVALFLFIAWFFDAGGKK